MNGIFFEKQIILDILLDKIKTDHKKKNINNKKKKNKNKSMDNIKEEINNEETEINNEDENFINQIIEVDKNEKLIDDKKEINKIFGENEDTNLIKNNYDDKFFLDIFDFNKVFNLK